LLTAVASLGALNAQAAKATATAPSSSQKVSMLGGKLTFSLPKGFTANTLPSSPSGASGTMYTNETTKTVVIAAENNLPTDVTVKDNDGAFLDGTSRRFRSRTTQGPADFNKLSEKSLTQTPQAWGCVKWTARPHRVAAMTLNTTLMAASGNRMAGGSVVDLPSGRHGRARDVDQTDRHRQVSLKG